MHDYGLVFPLPMLLKFIPDFLFLRAGSLSMPNSKGLDLLEGDDRDRSIKW
jgi:hypothetical protein